MPRRGNHDGSIRRRATGRWEGSIGLGGRRFWVTGQTRAEVQEKLQALRQAARLGTLVAPARCTVAEFLTDWLATVRPALRPTTWASYETLARCHVLPALGSVRLQALRPLHLARLYADLSGRLSPRRVQMVHRLVHKALADAQRWGVVGTNVADRVDAPRPEPREPRRWRPEQVALFVERVLTGTGGTYGFLFGFLLASGCRVGEALGLTWSDIEWASGAVRIERQVTWVQNRPLELPPKTRHGCRSVPLPSWGVELLRRQRAQVATWRVRQGAAWPGGERVFVATTGAVPSPANLRRAFLGLCRRWGLPPLRLHDLRHLHVSLLAMGGVPVRVAQARAGHSSPTLTLRVYSHVLGDAEQQAARVLERALEVRHG